MGFFKAICQHQATRHFVTRLTARCFVRTKHFVRAYVLEYLDSSHLSISLIQELACGVGGAGVKQLLVFSFGFFCDPPPFQNVFRTKIGYARTARYVEEFLKSF